MKKTLLVLVLNTLLLFVTSPVVSAEIPSGSKKRFKSEVQEMTIIMDLSSRQAEQIMELKIELYKKNQQARKQFSDNSPELSSAHRENFQDYRKSVSKIINKKQLETLWGNENI